MLEIVIMKEQTIWHKVEPWLILSLFVIVPVVLTTTFTAFPTLGKMFGWLIVIAIVAKFIEEIQQGRVRW